MIGFSAIAALIGLLLIVAGLVAFPSRPSIDVLRAHCQARAWELSNDRGTLCIAGTSRARVGWILTSNASRGRRGTLLTVGGELATTLAAVATPRDGRPAIRTVDGSSPVEVNPEGTDQRSHFVYLTLPGSAERLARWASKEMNLALDAFFDHGGRRTPPLRIHAGLRSVTFIMHQPVSDPVQLDLLVQCGLCAYDCLTGWPQDGRPVIPVGASPQPRWSG